MEGETKLERLAALPLFADFSPAELRDVAARADEVDIPAGEPLTQQGANCRELVVIASGAATVARDGETIGVLGEGDLVGELGLVTYTKRTATVTTTEPCHVFVLGERDFRRLIDDVPSFSRKVFAAAASRIV